jgi:hypothetical protein
VFIGLTMFARHESATAMSAGHAAAGQPPQKGYPSGRIP